MSYEFDPTIPHGFQPINDARNSRVNVCLVSEIELTYIIYCDTATSWYRLAQTYRSIHLGENSVKHDTILDRQGSQCTQCT